MVLRVKSKMSKLPLLCPYRPLFLTQIRPWPWTTLLAPLQSNPKSSNSITTQHLSTLLLQPHRLFQLLELLISTCRGVEGVVSRESSRERDGDGQIVGKHHQHTPFLQLTGHSHDLNPGLVPTAQICGPARIVHQNRAPAARSPHFHLNSLPPRVRPIRTHPLPQPGLTPLVLGIELRRIIQHCIILVLYRIIHSIPMGGQIACIKLCMELRICEINLI